MSKNIKPCRLCGSHGRIVIKHNRLCSHEFHSYSVACSFCGAEYGTYFSALEAIKNWNKINAQVRRYA